MWLEMLIKIHAGFFPVWILMTYRVLLHSTIWTVIWNFCLFFLPFNGHFEQFLVLLRLFLQHMVKVNTLFIQIPTFRRVASSEIENWKTENPGRELCRYERITRLFSSFVFLSVPVLLYLQSVICTDGWIEFSLMMLGGGVQNTRRKENTRS